MKKLTKIDTALLLLLVSVLAIYTNFFPAIALTLIVAFIGTVIFAIVGFYLVSIIDPD